MQTGGVATANLADGSVTGVKLNTGVVDGSTLQISANVMSVKTVDTGQLSTAVSQMLVPTGAVLPYAASSAPSGYLLCDGSAVSRTTYSALYAIIGITHGQGNGTTTFNVPDYRGQFLRGVDGTAGRDPDKASRTAMNTGGNTGNNVGSVQADAYRSHNHGEPGGFNFLTDDTNIAYTGANALGAGGYKLVPTTASSGGNETRPTNAYCQFIIKT